MPWGLFPVGVLESALSHDLLTLLRATVPEQRAMIANLRAAITELRTLVYTQRQDIAWLHAEAVVMHERLAHLELYEAIRRVSGRTPGD